MPSWRSSWSKSNNVWPPTSRLRMRLASLRCGSLLVRARVADDDPLDGGRRVRTVVRTTRRVDDLVRDVHSLRRLSEHRVLAVEEIGVLHHDEELRGGAVRIL